MKKILMVLFLVLTMLFQGCSYNISSITLTDSEKPSQSNIAGESSKKQSDDSSEVPADIEYERIDATNSKLVFPYSALVPMEDKKNFIKTLSQKDGLFDLHPYGIGNFFSDFDDENNVDFKENEKANLYGFTENFWEGCSVWCAVEDYHEVWKASSTLPHNKKINYDVKNLGEANRATTWCEGVDDYGIGQNVEADITIKAGNDLTYTTLCIVNGYAKDDTNWQENSRVKKLKMYVDGEPYAYISLDDTIKPQYFAIYDIIAKSNETKQFKFEIIDIYAGSKYKDTCLTGITFGFWTPNH